MSRGKTVKTPELLAFAQQRRAEGVTLKTIAAECGVSITTLHTWLHDPDLSKQRARRKSYGGQCKVCGGPTDGSGGPKAVAETCADCLRWTPEACLSAVLAFFEENSRSPRVTDARSDAGLPHEISASRLFGSWNALLLAADLPLNMDRRPETQAEMERMLRDGLTAHEIAEQFGWTEANVHMRLRTRGMTVRDLNPDYPSGSPRIPAETREQILPTYARMRSFAAAARHLGIDQRTVKRYVLEAKEAAHAA